MIPTRKVVLTIGQLRNLINDLVGNIDFVPTNEVPKCNVKGILSFTKDVETRYHLIQFLRESELVLNAYNITKNDLLKEYLSPEEKFISPTHSNWNEFYSKLSSLLGIEVTLSIPKIPIENFSGISGEGSFISFYEHIIGNKPWEISSQLTELQKKMREVTMMVPESTNQIQEEKLSKESPESITPIGLAGRRSTGLNTLLDSHK